ncbi:hypothetical protein KUTeg_015415 [Tegillarca granosa]|uniref:Uncharacterized protein n=1 Tax=Tegillarca granosa TaxID=220873 RepID=A0ABQ9ETP9_TEGGR|nr:hypothetical protein KUTeg_015415 [Tegillarca granosa]
MCGNCSNHGYCMFNESVPQTTLFEYAICVCEQGWTVNILFYAFYPLLFLSPSYQCENDVNGCSGHPCSDGRNCTDLTPAEEAYFGRPFNCSLCPKGYTENDKNKCSDRIYICEITVKLNNFMYAKIGEKKLPIKSGIIASEQQHLNFFLFLVCYDHMQLFFTYTHILHGNKLEKVQQRIFYVPWLFSAVEKNRHALLCTPLKYNVVHQNAIFTVFCTMEKYTNR